MEGQKVEPCGEELEVVNRALEGGSWRERDPEIRLNSPSCQLSRKVSLPREKLHEMRSNKRRAAWSRAVLVTPARPGEASTGRTADGLHWAPEMFRKDT